jgi:hypothetical protein
MAALRLRILTSNRLPLSAILMYATVQTSISLLPILLDGECNDSICDALISLHQRMSGAAHGWQHFMIEIIQHAEYLPS